MIDYPHDFLMLNSTQMSIIGFDLTFILEMM